MELRALEAIARAFKEEDVRSLIAGGMAVVAHGYGRMSFKIDVVIKPDRENVVKAFAALARIGCQPRVPITAHQFADRTTRESWIRDKGMVVLNMWSDQFKDTPLVLFVEEPFDFAQAEVIALRETLPDGTPIQFVGLTTLMDMKKSAGRPQDMDDLRHLELLSDEN